MTYATASLPAGTSAVRRKALSVVLWVLQVGAAAMFLNAGIGKLASNPAMVQAFGAIGFGQWFRYLTGGLEVVGAVLLLIPALAGAGALLMAMVMVGAVLTHLFLIGGSPLAAVILLAAMLPVAYLRREQTVGLLQRFIH